MWIEIEHELRFDYDDFISESRMELRVQPLSTEQQRLHSFLLAVGPPTPVHHHRDWLGNQVHHFAIGEFHERIHATARSLVATRAPDRTLESATTPPAALKSLGNLLDFTLFDGPVEHSPSLEALAAGISCSPGAGTGAQVHAIGAFLHDRFEYRTDVSDFRSSSDDLITSGAGVCQDFAHLMLALLRLRGIPCRYVNGYLHLDGDQPSQSHAWVEAHAPDRGWLAFDPTHDRQPNERYVVVGYGRHYDDVPPNRGIYLGAAKETLHAQVLTREGEPRGVASLHEEIASIEVPVFHELPSRPDPGHEIEPVDDDQTPQQQQQQQSRVKPRPGGAASAWRS